MIDLEFNVKELSQSIREQISEDDNEVVRASWRIEMLNFIWIARELKENSKKKAWELQENSLVLKTSNEGGDEGDQQGRWTRRWGRRGV